MKKIISAVALTLICAVAAMGADSIVLKAKNGNVTLDHKKHAAQGCKACHADEKGGKIADMNKDWAHKTCKGCHETKKAGPTKCGECHKK
jgi:cytochrome c553